MGFLRDMRERASARSLFLFYNFIFQLRYLPFFQYQFLIHTSRKFMWVMRDID